jgi:hypothetical protein
MWWNWRKKLLFLDGQTGEAWETSKRNTIVKIGENRPENYLQSIFKGFFSIEN